MALRLYIRNREKSDYIEIVESIVKKKLNNKIYNELKAPKWCKQINYEIFKFLNNRYSNFKFICTCFIFDKKNEYNKDFYTYCFWVKKTDLGSGLNYENKSLRCLINIFKIEKKREETVNYDYEKLGNLFSKKKYEKENDKNLIDNIIWLDKNITNVENKTYLRALEKKYESKKIKITSFDNLNKQYFEFLENINNKFKTMIFIISGNLYEDYITKLEDNLKSILYIPINIIFTSENYLNMLIKKSNNISEIVSNKISDSFYNQGICTNLEEILDKIFYFNNYDLDEETTLLDDNDYTGCFTFSIVKSYKDLIIPGIYGKIELENNKINQQDVKNFNYFLVKNFYSYDLKKLLFPFIKLKEVPFELISKIYARIYTFDDGKFYKVINQKLMKSEGELYETFVQMMYKGIEIKSFISKFDQVLYRGSYLSDEELKNLEEIDFEIHKRENDVPCGLVFSQTFLSFSKNENKAKEFAKNVIFIIEKLNVSKIEDSLSSNADINKFSVFTDEQEILFFPFSSFIVKKIENYEFEIKTDKKTVKKITLEYLGKYKTKIMEEILQISPEEVKEMFDNSTFGKILKKCRKKIEHDLEDKILDQIKKFKPKIIFLDKYEYYNKKNLQMNLEYKSVLDDANLKREKNNKKHKNLETGDFSKVNFEYEKITLNDDDRIKFLLILKNEKICVVGENEYIRIYNNYNFDDYYLIKAGSDKKDKCQFISQIDDDKIMCSTIWSKEFLIYKIKENEEECIYKEKYFNKNDKIKKGIQLTNNEILLISIKTKIIKFSLNEKNNKHIEDFHNDLEFHDVFDFKNEEVIIILYKVKSDFYVGFYNHIKKKFINSIKLTPFNLANDNICQLDENLVCVSCKEYLHLISTKEQKLTKIINLKDFNIKLYSCCQFEQYYIIIGDDKGYIHEFIFFDNQFNFVQKIKNENIINNLILKDNYIIATSYSNNPNLNPSLVKLYKADYDEILKQQNEFDINLLKK